MYTPTERLQHLHIPRSSTPIISIVFRLGHTGRDGRHNVFDVKVEDLIIDLGRGMGRCGDVQERREG